MRLSVLRTNEIGHGLGFALVVVRTVGAVVNIVAVVAVAVGVVALGRANVLHLVDGAALGAALDGAVAGSGEPDDNVGVGRVASAAEVLLVTEGFDGNGVLDGAWEDNRIRYALLRLNAQSDQAAFWLVQIRRIVLEWSHISQVQCKCCPSSLNVM